MSSNKTSFTDADEIEMYRQMLGDSKIEPVVQARILVHSIWARTLRYLIKYIAVILLGSSSVVAVSTILSWVGI